MTLTLNADEAKVLMDALIFYRGNLPRPWNGATDNVNARRRLTMETVCKVIDNLHEEIVNEASPHGPATTCGPES